MCFRGTAKWLTIGTLVLAVVMVCLAWYLPDVLQNNRRMAEMKRALEAVPTPPDTEQLIVRTAFGPLRGNAHHCDYFVGVLYRSASTANSVREHYQERIFLNPVTGREERVQLDVLASPEVWRNVRVPPALEVPQLWGISEQSFATGTVFLVSVMRSYEANRDCRCH